jgi:hypothetical protein
MDNMITVVTISKNNFMFDRNKYYNNLELLKNDIEEFVKITQIDSAELMDTIVTELQLTPELIGSSPICHQTDKNIYQLCYAGEKEENILENKMMENKISENANKIADYLISNSVENNCVLINSKIGGDKTCGPDSADIDTITQLLYSKFFHVGIVIKADDSCPVVEFIYGDHPLEYYRITTYDEDKYRIAEFDFISFGLCVLIDNQPENNIINKRMTRIIGKEVIYGDVLLILKQPEAYLDLTLELYQQINRLSFGPLIHRNLTEDEKKDPEKINDLHIVNNSYCIFNTRLNSLNYEMTCAYQHCTKTNDTLNLCKSCYRVKYHDKECQALDWNNHKSECFYDKL